MARTRKGLVWVVVVVGAFVAGTAQAQAPRLRVKKVFDRAHSTVLFSINDAGVGAGIWNTPDARLPATDDGTTVRVLPVPPDSTAGWATGINDLGQVVGRTWRGNLEAPYHAVTWEGGQLRILPVPQGFVYSEARALNELGDIVGQVAPTLGPSDPFRRSAFWHDGQVELIGPDGSTVHWINKRRQIVGCTGTDYPSSTTEATPFLWEAGQYKPLPPLTSGAKGCAYAISDGGVIVGRSGYRPVMWQGGSVFSIGPAYVSGSADAINNRGEALGQLSSQNISPAWYRPGSGGGLYYLPGMVDPSPLAPTAVFQQFGAINDRGEILAQGIIPGGGSIVALLEPYTPSGSDTVRPTISLTSPTTGSYVSDLIQLEASASDDVGVVSVQFFAEGSKVSISPLTAPPWRADLNTLRYENGPILVWAEARDAAGNVSITNMKSLFISNRCHSVATGQTFNGWLGTQTGTFTVRWSAEGFSADVLDAGFALARGKPTYFSGTSAIVLYAPDGEIKVRDGDHYPPSGVRYPLERFLHYRMTVDVPANRYSVWVKDANQPETQLAAGYAFRNPTSVLDGWMIRVDAASSGSFKACNVSVKSGP